MDLTALTVREAADALRRGDVSAVAYADALLAQAERQAGLDAFIHLDPQAVRTAAREADARRARGARRLRARPCAPPADRDG